MEDEARSHGVIQSTIRDRYGGGEKWFVSTIYRRCSAAAYQGWYYETLVWTLDADGKRQDIIWQGEGLRRHFEVCKRLLDTGDAEEPANDDN